MELIVGFCKQTVSTADNTLSTLQIELESKSNNENELGIVNDKLGSMLLKRKTYIEKIKDKKFQRDLKTKSATVSTNFTPFTSRPQNQQTKHNIIREQRDGPPNEQTDWPPLPLPVRTITYPKQPVTNNNQQQKNSRSPKPSNQRENMGATNPTFNESIEDDFIWTVTQSRQQTAMSPKPNEEKIEDSQNVFTENATAIKTKL